MFSINTLDYAKQGVKIVNVGRGPLIDQAALLEGMRKDLIAAALGETSEHDELEKRVKKGKSYFLLFEQSKTFF